MTNSSSFDVLKSILYHRIVQLPNHRTAEPNTRYAIQEALGRLWHLFHSIAVVFGVSAQAATH